MPEVDTASPLGPPMLPWRSPGAHEHLLAPSCLSTSVSGPEYRQTLPCRPVTGSPTPPHYLMEFLIVHLCPVQLRRIRSMPARPRFSTSRQRPVPLFIMAPFWVKGGEGGKKRGREEKRERERDLTTWPRRRTILVQGSDHWGLLWKSLSQTINKLHQI